MSCQMKGMNKPKQAKKPRRTVSPNKFTEPMRQMSVAGNMWRSVPVEVKDELYGKNFIRFYNGLTVWCYLHDGASMPVDTNTDEYKAYVTDFLEANREWESLAQEEKRAQAEYKDFVISKMPTYKAWLSKKDSERGLYENYDDFRREAKVFNYIP